MGIDETATGEDARMAAFNASLRAKLLSARLPSLSREEVVSELDAIAADCLLAMRYQDKLQRRSKRGVVRA